MLEAVPLHEAKTALSTGLVFCALEESGDRRRQSWQRWRVERTYGGRVLSSQQQALSPQFDFIAR